MARPLLDEIELQHVQHIDVVENDVAVSHSVPALEGDFIQRLNRRAVAATLTGVMTGPDARDKLNSLRQKFRAAVPVTFVADATTATRVGDVLIKDLEVTEFAGKPERFAYTFRLREFIPPPPVAEEPPPEIEIPESPAEQIDQRLGTLIVTSNVEGQAEFPFERINVEVRGTTESGTSISRSLTNRTDNIWTEEDFPGGEYVVEAIASASAAITASASVSVQAGATTEETLTLRPGDNVARAFVIHFLFDKAFVEPCLRSVMREVVDYAEAHPDEKLVILGHTDLGGSAAYNQSLSERRARAVYAYLTYGREREAAITEWNELRKSRPSGQLPSLHDTWSVREYQYMLQDLGYYVGNIDEEHGSATDEAVREFQTDQGLSVTGQVDENTWPELIDAYLEEGELSVAEDRFFENCPGEPLKWLGCGEQDPVKNTQDAWRPNRRTEILFVNDDSIPCEVPRPVTFDLPAAGFVGSDWCLGPDDENNRVCFITRESEQPDKWLVQPAVSAKTVATGQVTFEDGTPVANARYALITPDGEYLHEDGDGNPDLGERPSGPQSGRPIAGRTDEQGRFHHPRHTPVGTYILELLELDAPQVARVADDPPHEARGNVICVRLDQPPEAAELQLQQSDAASDQDAGSPQLSAVILAAPARTPPVVASIEPDQAVVMVGRPHTSPARVPITLRTNVRHRGMARLDRPGSSLVGDIEFFTAATGGTKIEFGDEFSIPGRRLRVFAEASDASQNVDDFVLTLTLLSGSTPVGTAATARLTAVRLTLNIFDESGTRLPEPPNAFPVGTPDDKWFQGGVITVQDSQDSQPRFRLQVDQVQPSDFAGELRLQQVEVSTSNTIGSRTNRVRTFDNDEPTTPAETPKANRFDFPATTDILGRDFFIEGNSASSRTRDTGFQLGIKGVEDDGDRVAVTVAVAPVVDLTSPVVLRKKVHTNPTRQPVTLRTTASFGRSGTLTRSGADIDFFLTDTGGTAIVFPATFTGAQLRNAGVQLFAEGVAPSAGMNQFKLTLTLSAGAGAPEGPPATAQMTSVELTLDVFQSRTAPGTDPTKFSEVDKINPGRSVQVRDSSFTHERAMFIVRQPNPTNFAGELILTPLNPPAAPLGPLVELFNDETPFDGQPVITTPHLFLSGLVFGDGSRFFVEATRASAVARDTGFQLGIVGVDNDGDRAVMTAVQVDASDTGTAAAPSAAFTRFGLWDNAYDAGGGVRNLAAEANNFIGSDTRNFHFRVRDPGAADNVSIDWKTLRSDGTTDDDAPPTSQLLSLPQTGAGSGVFISRGVMLVTDNTDRNFPTNSGLAAPLDVGNRAFDQSNHRTRRAAMDGFVRAEYSPQPGVRLRIALPIFNRQIPFNTTSATNVTPGTRVVTPAAMSGTINGIPFSITANSLLTIDTGADQEAVLVTSVTATTFTAVFTRAHDGTVAPFSIAGFVDERRRASIRVIRYNDASLVSATNAYIANQFQHANDRWNQIGLQIDAQATVDRPIPAAALTGSEYGGSRDNANEQAALGDLIPITPDDTITVVFVPLSGANAYATTLERLTVALGNRFFIFIDENLDLTNETLAHEFHHVLFNRLDAAVDDQFFTFNTTPPLAIAAPLGIALPDARIYRRIQNLHSPDPNVDPTNANIINWIRRVRTTRFPNGGGAGAATASTGNTTVQPF